jgi:hypothetical protein
MLLMTALSTDPLTMPMPVIEPTETCVVDTGIPRRLATITMKAVTRLAVSAWPSFMRDIFLLMVTAMGIEPAADRHCDSHSQQAHLKIQCLNDEQ